MAWANYYQNIVCLCVQIIWPKNDCIYRSNISKHPLFSHPVEHYITLMTHLELGGKHINVSHQIWFGERSSPHLSYKNTWPLMITIATTVTSLQWVHVGKNTRFGWRPLVFYSPVAAALHLFITRIWSPTPTVERSSQTGGFDQIPLITRPRFHFLVHWDKHHIREDKGALKAISL